MESTVLTLLFVTAALLSVSAILTLVPLMRRFEKEGRKAGFDFYSLRAGLWFFHPESLPAQMEPIGRKIRVCAVLLLWPAFALLCIAWIIDR
jgi:hypothetical protein